MKTVILDGSLAPALLLGASLPAVLAVERGGTLDYGRYADSLFLDPVLNDANVDIWVLSQPLRHAAAADRRRQGRAARPRHRLEGCPTTA